MRPVQMRRIGRDPGATSRGCEWSRNLTSKWTAGSRTLAASAHRTLGVPWAESGVGPSWAVPNFQPLVSSRRRLSSAMEVARQ
jgi:hypothetical protein